MPVQSRCFGAQGPPDGVDGQTGSVGCWHQRPYRLQVAGSIQEGGAAGAPGPILLAFARPTLVSHFNLSLNRDPNHDELQALVSGLAGIPMLGGTINEYRVDGVAPFSLGGSTREGFIFNPTTTAPVAKVRADQNGDWSI